MKNKARLVLCVILLSLLAQTLNAPVCAAAKGWTHTYGGASTESASTVVQTTDGRYAVAGFTESYGAGGLDFWLVKADSSGNMKWSHTYGGTKDEEAYSVIQTSDGGYAVAGETNSYGAGKYDCWLVKTDANGSVPEFPSLFILPLLIATTLVAVTVRGRGRLRRMHVSKENVSPD